MKKLLKKRILITLTIIILAFVISQIPALIMAGKIYGAITNRKVCYVSESDKEIFAEKLNNIENNDFEIVFLNFADYRKNIQFHFGRFDEIVFNDNETDNYTIKANVNPMICLYGWKKITIWVQYSAEIIDKNGERLTGSWRIPVKITLELIDEKWSVTDIYERP